MVEETFDIEKVRADTPGCTKVLHFNNAGAGLMPRQVLDAVTGHLSAEATVGGYEAAAAADAAVEHTYDAIAALLHCDRSEVALLENATRAWDAAFYAVPLGPGDRILTSVAEYASNVIAFLQVAERTGARVEVVPDDEHGQLSVSALADLLDERVKLVAMTHVPTNGGLVNPAAEVGAVVRDSGALYLLDACQSAGQLDLDVTELGCDMLSVTGRKYLRGPRGTGFLYVRDTALARLRPAMLDLHAAKWVERERYEMRPDARRFETWESYVAGRIGLGVAVDYALSLGLPAIEQRTTALAARLRDRLAEVPGVTLRDRGARRCGIVTFTVDGHEPSAIRDALAGEKMNVTVAVPHSTLYDALGRDLPDMVRASVHYYNTDEEIDRFVGALSAGFGRN